MSGHGGNATCTTEIVHSSKICVGLLLLLRLWWVGDEVCVILNEPGFFLLCSNLKRFAVRYTGLYGTVSETLSIELKYLCGEGLVGRCWLWERELVLQPDFKKFEKRIRSS